jgi:hypothetical protein
MLFPQIHPLDAKSKSVRTEGSSDTEWEFLKLDKKSKEFSLVAANRKSQLNDHMVQMEGMC